MSKPSTLPRDEPRRATAEEVAAYLREHPDFLERNPDLLAVLAPPRRHNGGDVADLQHYMIERLQGKVGALRDDRAQLITLSREARSRQSRVHSAILDILGVRTFEHFVETVTTDLAVKLDVDVVRLCMENENTGAARTRAGVRLLAPGTVDRVMDGERDIALRPSIEAERDIYGTAAPLVRSDALLRLTVSPVTPAGLLALGSRRAGQFTANRDVELFGFLARVLECTARAWLDLPG